MEPDRPADALDAELDRLAELVASLDAEAGEPDRERVIEILRSIDRVHRPGLRRLSDLVRSVGLESRALDDPGIRLLWDLYDLGEEGDADRARAVLAAVSPYIESHGGALEVVGAERGVVRVALSGACSGCQGSTATLHHVIESALRDGLPEFVRLDVVDTAPANGHSHDAGVHDGAAHAHGVDRPGIAHGAGAAFVPLESVRTRSPGRLSWEAVLHLVDLPPGSLRSVAVGMERVLVANVDGDVYAYRDACPGTPLGLGAARLDEGAVLVCPWHGCRFELRGGRRVDATGPGLGVVPVSVVNGDVQVGRLEPAAVT